MLQPGIYDCEICLKLSAFRIQQIQMFGIATLVIGSGLVPVFA